MKGDGTRGKRHDEFIAEVNFVRVELNWIKLEGDGRVPDDL